MTNRDHQIQLSQTRTRTKYTHAQASVLCDIAAEGHVEKVFPVSELLMRRVHTEMFWTTRRMAPNEVQQTTKQEAAANVNTY